MLRGICFCICMSVMLSLFAQNEESNFIAPDRTVHKRSEIIKRAIKNSSIHAISTQHISAPIDITTP